MSKIELRKHMVSNAKIFYRMLKAVESEFFSVKAKSVADERKWLSSVPGKMKKNLEFNYAIYEGDDLVGGCGIKIDQHQKHIGEVGYFIAKEHWNRGLATKAVRLLEKKGFNELGLKRIEIRMNIRHKASERVAVKAGYKKEGTFRKCFNMNGRYVTCNVYAKVR